jgi:hypothetical protein
MVAEEQDGSGRSGGFDPRYDPSFQRGYQPQPGERAQTRVRAVAPDSAYRRPSSLLQRPAETDDDDLPPADVRAALVREPEAALEPAPTAPAYVVGTGTLARLDVSPRRNPLILALWIVGGGFVVLGIVLYCISVTSSYSGPTPSSDVGSLVFAQLGWMLAGPLITVGLATLVGLLFLNALAGRRAPVETPPDEEL